MNGDGVRRSAPRAHASQHLPGRGDAPADGRINDGLPSTITVSNPDEDGATGRSEPRRRDRFVYVASGEVMGFLARPDGTLLDGFTVPRPEVAGPSQPLLDVHTPSPTQRQTGRRTCCGRRRAASGFRLAGSTNAGMLTTIETAWVRSPRSATPRRHSGPGDELDPQEPDGARRLQVGCRCRSGVERELARVSRTASPAIASAMARDAAEHRFGGFLVGTPHRGGDANPATLVERTHFQAGLGADSRAARRPLSVDREDAAGVLMLSRERWTGPLITSRRCLPRSRGCASPRWSSAGRSTPRGRPARSPCSTPSVRRRGQPRPDTTGQQDRPSPTLRIVRTFAHNSTHLGQGRLVEETAEGRRRRADVGGCGTLYDGAASPLPPAS